MNDITPKEAIANLNHIYGMVAPDIQRSLDVAIKALERPQGKWLFKHNSSDIWCSVCDENFGEIPQAFNFCPNCGADMRTKESEDV